MVEAKEGAGNGFVLNAATVVIDESKTSSVGFAAEALRRDIGRKVGFSRGRSAGGRIILRLDAGLKGFDRHAWEVGREEVVIRGSDELGLIHGIYQFAEKYLEADPFSFFTQIVPELAACVEVPVGKHESLPYTYRHRGLFFNDEDLLVGFQMESPEHGFNMDVWRELIEMTLRLQCTCIIAGTNILPDEPQIKMSSDMGLYIAQHHAEPLGCAPFYWPRGVQYSWTVAREHMIEYWRRAIQRQVGKKVLWTLNFRGLLDRPFWIDDPNLGPEAPIEAKAKVINEAIQTQYDLVREIRGEENPEVYGYLWGELLELYQTGLLKYPPGTIMVHSDRGCSTMSSDLEELVKASPYRTGVYQHVSMFSGQVNMRVLGVEPRVYEREVKRTIDLGMTEFFMLNVANVREKIFGIRQMMAYANHYPEAIQAFDGQSYYQWYTRKQLDTDHPEVAAVYRGLLETPFPFDDNADHLVGDNFYANVVRYTLGPVYAHQWDQRPGLFRGKYTYDGKPVGNVAQAMQWCIERTGPRRAQWDAVYQRALNARRHLSGSRLWFYENEVLAQVEKMMHLNNMVYAFATSVTHYINRRIYDAYLEAYQSLRHMDMALEVEKRIENGKFKDWHRNDLNCRTWKNRDFLAHYHAMLNDLRWINIAELAEGPQCIYAAYKYHWEFPTAYRSELHLATER